jgi:hypothetical protein
MLGVKTASGCDRGGFEDDVELGGHDNHQNSCSPFIVQHLARREYVIDQFCCVVGWRS